MADAIHYIATIAVIAAFILVPGSFLIRLIQTTVDIEGFRGW
jgi:hypothetical protein